MNKMKIASYIILIVSVLAILYALIFNPADWIVYAIAIVCIPFLVLSFGLYVQTNKRGRGGKKRRTIYRLLVKIINSYLTNLESLCRYHEFNGSNFNQCCNCFPCR